MATEPIRIPIRSVLKDVTDLGPDVEILVDDGVSMGRAKVSDAVDKRAKSVAQQEISDLNLGSASQSDVGDFATSGQGALADSAVQPGDLGAVATSNDYGDLDNLPTLGTAAAADTGDFATAAEGTLATTALQPIDIGDTVQAQGAFLDALSGMTPGSAGQVIAFDSNGDPIATNAGAGDLIAANNLSDVSDKELAAGNLGLIKFNTVPLLLADETMSYDDDPGKVQVGPGDVVEAGGFRYEVAADDATDAHVETAGGVKLIVLPDGQGRGNIAAFGERGDAARFGSNITIETGSTLLTVSSGSFNQSDVGKTILVGGAGAGGLPLVSTIASVVDSTTITLGDVAASDLSDERVNITYGYDSTDAFQKCAGSFLSWAIPEGKFIVSGATTLRAGSVVKGAGNPLTQIYRIADEPIFRVQNAGTGRTQRMKFGGMYLYGRGPTDTSQIFDARGLSYAYFDDLQIIGDPIGSGGFSTAQCLGLDLTRGGASFNGYIKFKDVFILYCDIGLDANVNQFEIEGGSLNANRTFGGIIRGAALTITNTEISSNARGQTAEYVGEYPDGHYDRGGLLLGNLSGATIKGVWHESNANRVEGQYSRNDIDVTSTSRRIFIDADRRDGWTTKIHGLGLDTGSYPGSGFSSQTQGFFNLVNNGRLERIGSNGTPLHWSNAGNLITVSPPELLPEGVVGKKLTGSTGVPQLRQVLIAPAEIPKYIGKRITVSFWVAIHDQDWTGGHVRAGISTNPGGALSNGNYVSWTNPISSADEPIRVSVIRDIDGGETNGLGFAVQFYRTDGPWSIELGDVSAAIGDVVPAVFEKPITTGNFLDASTTYNPPSLDQGESDDIQTLSVPGAASGDFVMASFSQDMQGLELQSWVSASDTVSYRFFHPSGASGAVDLASGVVRVRVMKA